MNLSVLKRARYGISSTPGWQWLLYADGGIGGLYVILTGGTVMTGLILWLRGGAFDLGLLSALTTGGGLLVIATRRLQVRYNSNKNLTKVTWVATRALWLPLALVLLAPLLVGSGLSPALLMAILMATVFVTSAVGNIGNVTWFGWCAELIPASKRGGFLAQRAQWVSVASLVALPLVGLWLDETHAHQLDGLGFAAALALNGILAIAGWELMGRVPAAVAAPPETSVVTKSQTSGAVSGQRLAIYTVIFQVGVYFSAPFMQAWAIDRLGMSLGTLLNLQIVAQVIPILTLGLWGTVVDRLGIRLPLGVCSLAKAVVPIFYIMSSHTVLWPFYLTYLLSVLDAGILVANNAAFAALAGQPQGSAQVVHLSLLISIFASITPLIVGYLIAHVAIGTLDILAIMFVISAIGRGLSGIVLLMPGGAPKYPHFRRRPRRTTLTPNVG